MSRPLPLRYLPPRLRQVVYYRHYRKRQDAYLELFRRAPLALCPDVSMYDLMPGDVISAPIAFMGFFEWELSQRIARHAGSGGLLVDVGANMGYFSLLWTGRGNGKAIAVEAAPRNVKLLRNNLRRNHLDTRVTLIPKAAGHGNGTIPFAVGPDDQTGWGGIAAERKPEHIDVPLVRLDDVVSAQTVDVLKIDVEGADTLVLRGCEALLRGQHIRRIYFEQNEARMAQLGIARDEARQLLGDHGYEVAPLLADQSEWTAYPRP